MEVKHVSAAPLLRHFRKLNDTRINRRKLHSLKAILVIATCAVIAGANDFQQAALFAHKRKDWLKCFLGLPNGVPSHDTFERVFARLDPSYPSRAAGCSNLGSQESVNAVNRIAHALPAWVSTPV